MNVHIVLPRFENANRILPRKAKVLVDAFGWTLSPKPDRAADLNYFFPYLAYEPVDTPTAAYFTHREGKNRQAKADDWDRVAAAVNLRVTSSSHNLPFLEPFGPTVIAVPPLDHRKFRPALRPVAHARPVVGTSGYVYPGGRKGEGMIAAVRDGSVGRTVDWIASGRGWPVPTKGYLWSEMQRFYQGLDVYVCTSLLEGVGYGPLEALASGVPVVIPHGVGMFDELGEAPGICRYEAGDVAGLERALANALAVAPDQERLVAATAMFTAERWASDHEAAFSGLLAPMVAEAEEPLPDWRGNSGLYVVAFGEPSRRCAVRCIEAFRRHNPGVPVMLCSDRALGPEDMLVVQRDADIGGRQAKLSVYEKAPAEWRYVLYLDADTVPQRPLDALFQALADGWEFAICKNPERFAVARYMVRPDNRDECQAVFDMYGTDEMMQWNGGVFGFRRCRRVRDFFSLWRREWDRLGGRDQPPLLRTLWQMPLRALWLTNLWNLDPKYHTSAQVEQAAILHWPEQARRWRGLIHGRTDSDEAWQAVARFQGQPVGAK